MIRVLRKARNAILINKLRRQDGFILIAALTLMATLILVGATTYIVTSSNVKVGANFKTSQTALQVAMAGAERGREVLRLANASSSDKTKFSDELISYKGGNNVLEGYAANSDDPVLASGTLGSYTYSAYLTNNVNTSTADTQYSTTDNDGIAMITTVATGPNNSKAVVQTLVKLFTGQSSPATIYSKGDVTGNGSSLTISGNDECGQASAVAPIYTEDPATTNLNGNPTLSGSPATQQNGTMDLPIEQLIESLKSSANYTVTEDQNNANYGDSNNYKIVYSDTNNPPNNQGLKLQNVEGYGILLVKGDLVLGGGFKWFGPILVTGSVTLNGGGGVINIHGQILSGTSTLTDVTVNGGNVINYNSCDIKKSYSTQPLTVVNWKQNL